MAGDWIKMRENIHEDPAVVEMAERLGTRPEHVVGYCHRFWSWASRNSHDGTVTGVTLASLGIVLGLPNFPEILREVGWLEYDDSGKKPVISIPKFDRHLSQGAKARALAAERARSARVTKTSRYKRNESAPEKRREEKIIPPPTPAIPSGEFEPDGLPAEWSEVVAVVRDCGVGNAEGACEAARERGATTDEVRRIAEHFAAHPGAWTPGLLHSLLTRIRPGEKVVWPEPAVDIERQRAREELAKRQLETSRRTQNGLADRDRERQAAEKREQLYGARLDAMKKAKLREFVAEKFPAMAHLVPERGPLQAGLLRAQCLLELEAAETQLARKV